MHAHCLSPSIFVRQRAGLNFVACIEDIVIGPPRVVAVFGYDIGILCIAGIFQSGIKTGLWRIARMMRFHFTYRLLSGHWPLVLAILGPPGLTAPYVCCDPVLCTTWLPPTAQTVAAATSFPCGIGLKLAPLYGSARILDSGKV